MKDDLRERTKAFALGNIRVFATLPKETVAQVLGKQLLRSATSVGANYREANRARSSPEFIAKVGICLQELDESAYWMELLIEAANSGQRVEDHFVGSDQMIEIGKGGQRAVNTLMMSRYACYLVIQNADPAKEIVSQGQTYFAIQTRRQELSDDDQSPVIPSATISFQLTQRPFHEFCNFGLASDDHFVPGKWKQGIVK